METATPAPVAMLDELVAVVGRENVLVDRDLVAAYEEDWTGRWRGHASAVVRPGSTDEVAGVLRVCSARRQRVVVQGGNTGLVGGAVPDAGDVVLSTRRLEGLSIDRDAAEASVGAGVTLQQLQVAARTCGLAVGVDIAARGSATIGGMIATNAGGVHVLRHGPMRDQVIGLRAVLMDGRIIERMTGLRKESMGYDLVGLLSGSEGTLAVVTEARLRLLPSAREVVTALVAVEDLACATAVLRQVSARSDTLRSAELMLEPGLALVCEHAGSRHPFDRAHGAYLLLEWAGARVSMDEVLEAMGNVDEIADATVASDAQGRSRLWTFREGHAEAISARGVPHKLDVSVPPEELVGFLAETETIVRAAAPSATMFVFGHLAEGNLHVNLLGLDPDNAVIDTQVLEAVIRRGGDVSAEHGVGRAKADWARRSRTSGELDLYAAMKSSFDPEWLLNRNVKLPGSTRGQLVATEDGK